MSAIGGSIESMSINGRTFEVASDADAAIRTGDPDVEIQINGGGSARVIVTKMPWAIGGVVLSIDTHAGELEFLRELKSSGKMVPISITLANGDVFSGTGIPTGELTYQTANSTATVECGGPGKLDRQ